MSSLLLSMLNHSATQLSHIYMCNAKINFYSWALRIIIHARNHYFDSGEMFSRTLIPLDKKITKPLESYERKQNEKYCSLMTKSLWDMKLVIRFFSLVWQYCYKLPYTAVLLEACVVKYYNYLTCSMGHSHTPKKGNP